MIAESDTSRLGAKAQHKLTLNFNLRKLVFLLSGPRSLTPRHKVISSRLVSLPHPSRSETKQKIKSKKKKKTLANWTGAEACATLEKNENKKSEKDTDVVQTVYDRPKRRARVTAKGRSDKKVVVQRGGVHRVRRMIRLRGLTAGTDRTNPGQSIPEHPWDAASSQTALCEMEIGRVGSPEGPQTRSPFTWQSLLACGAHPLSLSSF